MDHLFLYVMTLQDYVYVSPTSLVQNVIHVILVILDFQTVFKICLEDKVIFQLNRLYFSTRGNFSRDFNCPRGDRYFIAYIGAKFFEGYVLTYIYMCAIQTRMLSLSIFVFSLLMYCTNLCLLFRVTIFGQNNLNLHSLTKNGSTAE